MAFTNIFLNGLVMLKKLCNVFTNSMCSGKSNVWQCFKEKPHSFLIDGSTHPAGWFWMG